MSQDNLKLEKLLEWVAMEMYIRRKDVECTEGVAYMEWERSRKQLSEKVEGIRESL